MATNDTLIQHIADSQAKIVAAAKLHIDGGAGSVDALRACSPCVYAIVYSYPNGCCFAGFHDALRRRLVLIKRAEQDGARAEFVYLGMGR